MTDILEIEEGVLKNCTDKSVTSVTIPDGVTEIILYAFRNCRALKSVEIPASVKRISKVAFLNCTSLSTITLADNFEKVPAEWFESVNDANPNYEIICTKDSSTYNAVRRSPKLRTHIKDLALQVAKDKKIAEVQNAGADALIKTLLSSVADSSFEILSSTKSATVAMVQIGKNIGVFKLGADSSKWLPKIKKVIEAFSDLSKSGADIFAVIQEQKLPLAKIPVKKAKFLMLKADCDGFMNLFVTGKLIAKRFKVIKSIALFGVTAIGEGAFNGCESLTSVVIPPSVTAIDYEAFRGCESLTSVVIPSSVTVIGMWAFSGCESLTSVVIPSSVTVIGMWAFSGCKSLSSVVIPSSVTIIDYEAFRGCESLSTVTLGDDFEKVPSEWFDSLNEANANYEIICTEGSRTYKAIKRSARLKAHVKTLALQNAKNKKIAQVNKAGADAVLSSLLAGKADSSFEILSNTKSATVVLLKIAKNTGVFKLGTDSAKWLPKIKKVIEAFSDLSKSGADIFSVIQELKLPLAEIPVKKAKLLMLKADCDGFMNLFVTGKLIAKQFEVIKSIALFGVTEIGENAFKGCKSLTSVVIPPGVTEIGAGAFSGCESLMSVVIPDGVTEIGASAFFLCESLSSVVIPSSVTEICANAFHCCKSLTSVVIIPPGVTEIGERAFIGCESLTSVVIPPGVTEICARTFSRCKSLTSVVIPEGVTKIGASAFNFCESLTSVVIPPSVTEIGKNAFNGCESITSVVIPPGVTEIGEYAFKGCNINELSHPLLSIKDGLVVNGCKVLYCARQSGSVTIPEGVTEIGASAFSSCKSLTSVVIPDGVMEIGTSAFSSCKSLTSVVIPSSVTVIGSMAFFLCEALTSVVIPPGVTEIGEEAFKGCNINELSHPLLAIKDGLVVKGSKVLYCASQSGSVTIPDGVTEIGEEAFRGCKSLTSVVIPSSVTAIGRLAFYVCESLEMIEFGGTIEQWDAVKKEEGWHYGVPATSLKCSN